jgi:hypothetical protein
VAGPNAALAPALWGALAMNAYPFRVPFHTSVPTAEIKGGHLFIRTSPWQSFFNLFSHGVDVHFDNTNQRVTIREKRWWQWKGPLRITYNDINYIDLTFPRVVEDQDEIPNQIYTLLLITKNPFRKIHIGTFGGAMSEAPIFRKAAQSCAELVARHTGIRFGVISHELPESGFNDKYVCKSCGHQLHPDAEFVLCKYCGGQEIEIVARDAG